MTSCKPESGLRRNHYYQRTSLVAQIVKHLPTMRETWVQSLGQEYSLEKEMATHCSILAWKIPWMEEPGRLQSMGSLRVGHNWATFFVSFYHYQNLDLSASRMVRNKFLLFKPLSLQYFDMAALIVSIIIIWAKSHCQLKAVAGGGSNVYLLFPSVSPLTFLPQIPYWVSYPKTLVPYPVIGD